MKFDVVCGNPSYNNDLYIDFILKSHNISKNCHLWVTPAKWQFKSSNKQFREVVLPYMSDVVYYPDEKEVFKSINVGGGIAYYLVDKKDKHDKKYISTRFIKNNLFTSNSYRNFEFHLCDFVNDLIKHIRGINDLSVADIFDLSADHYGLSGIPLSASKEDGIQVFGGNQYGVLESVGYIKRSDIHKNNKDIDKYKLTLNVAIRGGGSSADSNGTYIGMSTLNILEPNMCTKDHYANLVCDADMNYLKSIKSYLETKLINFIFVFSLCGDTLSNKEVWRYIPLVHFNKIYNDESVYEMFNIDDKTKSVIERTIRKR